MQTNRSEIPTLWWGWILVMSVIGLIFGLALVFLPRPLDFLNAANYDSIFGAGTYSAASDTVLGYNDWLYGVVGSTLAGWSVLIGAVALYPFRQGEMWAWWALVLALIVWFVPDMITSWLHDAWPNVAVNLAFIIAFGIPLAGSWRAFRSAESASESGA